MSAITTTPSWQWPADILVFAAQHQIDSYLQPLLQATRDLFPQARSIKVFLESDPEISDDWHVIYEVIVPQGYVSDYLRAQRSWTAELFRLCPKPLVCWFRLTLLPDET